MLDVAGPAVVLSVSSLCMFKVHTFKLSMFHSQSFGWYPPGSPTTVFHRLVYEPPFFNSNGLSSSKRTHHVLNGGWLPGFKFQVENYRYQGKDQPRLRHNLWHPSVSWWICLFDLIPARSWVKEQVFPQLLFETLHKKSPYQHPKKPWKTLIQTFFQESWTKKVWVFIQIILFPT